MRKVVTLVGAIMAVCLLLSVATSASDQGTVDGANDDRNGGSNQTDVQDVAFGRSNDAFWSSVGSGTNGLVCAVAVYQGKLIAGGTFTHADGVEVNRIAAWDGTSWSRMGTANFTYTISALQEYQGQLYVGGGFNFHYDNSMTHGIAGWDGYSNTWFHVSGGVNDFVLRMTVYDDCLVAGGMFTSAGGVPANYIAKWCGSSWASLGSGFSDPDGDPQWGAYALAATEYQGELYAGGVFMRAGGTTVNHIASWDGASWDSLGSGTNGSCVQVLQEYDSLLIVGGSFEYAGGVPASRIAAWNGSEWSSFGGSGMDGLVGAFTMYNGRLVVAGHFTHADGVEVNRIAWWTGETWAPFGAGVNGPVRGLVVYDSALIACGEFTTAGGSPVNNIAQWKMDCADVDGDWICDSEDNCPDIFNPEQTDVDGDGAGDFCDVCAGFDDADDADSDGVPDGCDACPGYDDLADSDGDTVPDGCDNCPETANTDQVDVDEDGYGAVCDPDDADSTVYPGAPELCDGLDNDGVDGIPEGEIDNDGDGYVECEIDAGGWDGDPLVVGGDDCDDSDSNTHPGAAPLDDPEACMTDADGDDYGDDQVSPPIVPGTDCDDSNAEIGPATEWFLDADLDTFGNPDSSLMQCEQPVGYVLAGGDCDDTDPRQHPETVWYIDEDGDGWGTDDSTIVGCDQQLEFVLDHPDNCPSVFNPGYPEQEDNDRDGIGNVCCCTGPTLGNVDASPDNLVTMGDLTVLIDHLFISLDPLNCPEEGNVDLSVDGLVTMGDLTILIDHLFISLTPLPPCP